MKESEKVVVDIIGAIGYVKPRFDKEIMNAKKKFCKEKGWGLRETKVEAHTKVAVIFSREVI